MGIYYEYIIYRQAAYINEGSFRENLILSGGLHLFFSWIPKYHTLISFAYINKVVIFVTEPFLSQDGKTLNILIPLWKKIHVSNKQKPRIF